jgi:hypothetical protein
MQDLTAGSVHGSIRTLHRDSSKTRGTASLSFGMLCDDVAGSYGNLLVLMIALV